MVSASEFLPAPPDVAVMVSGGLIQRTCFFSRLVVTNATACSRLVLFRFHVLSKLLSFMAPIDHTTMNDDAR